MSTNSQTSPMPTKSDDSVTVEVQGRWNQSRETLMALWVRQLVSFSFLYMRASRSSRLISFFSTFMSVVGVIYTIPGYGCGIVTGSVCNELQWSGIILGVVVGLVSILAAIYDPGGKSVAFDMASKKLLKVSRLIDNELVNEPQFRIDPNTLWSTVITVYEDVVDNTRLPWFISGEQQLANISLIRSYKDDSVGEMEIAIAAEKDQDSNKNKDDTKTNTKIQTQTHRLVLLTDTDRATMNRINFEMGRLSDDPVRGEKRFF